jgi:hypothetical protein
MGAGLMCHCRAFVVVMKKFQQKIQAILGV